ncbi:MAG: DUF1778 domain-containing protein [Bacteroidales bacterium]|nr:DUF1778 domain-containing protein [Bacteroidales bacterium]MDD3989208.1 DUF1778 domain-containing protein [Bacteroidales bacterium]
MADYNSKKARFDTRLLKEQKEFFERAAALGGYRSLSDFVIVTVQNRAKEIIEANERVIASEDDKKIFFDALVNPPAPDKNLLIAKEEYLKLLDE